MTGSQLELSAEHVAKVLAGYGVDPAYLVAPGPPDLDPAPYLRERGPREPPYPAWEEWLARCRTLREVPPLEVLDTLRSVVFHGMTPTPSTYQALAVALLTARSGNESSVGTRAPAG